MQESTKLAMIKRFKELMKRKLLRYVTGVFSSYGIADTTATNDTLDTMETKGFKIAVWGRPRSGKVFFGMQIIKAVCNVCRKKGDHITIDGLNYECKGCGQIWTI